MILQDYSDAEGASDEDEYYEEQRWVPYRHTNGVAIYHHNEGGSSSTGPGGEYMASSIVRGSPDECLSVLMDLSSHTTILGPASRIELLEDAEERQVRAKGISCASRSC